MRQNSTASSSVFNLEKDRRIVLSASFGASPKFCRTGLFPEWEEQARVVDSLIRQLGAETTPCLRVFNKCDAYMGILPHGEDVVCISAKSGEGADVLVKKLADMLDKGKKRVSLKIPYAKSALVDMLNREAAVTRCEYTDEGIEMDVTVPPQIFGKIKEFIPGYVEPKEEWED